MKSQSNILFDSTPISFDSVFTQQIWEDFFPRLAQLARKKLGNLPRRAMDEEDVALSAINSFFTRMKAGQFKLEERDDLWRLLATITTRKVNGLQRHDLAQKRGRGTVRGESVFEVNGDKSSGGIGQVFEIKNTPEFPEQVLIECEELLNQLKNDRLRQTALMRMQGYNNKEISEHLGCSVARTKQRIASIKQKWESALNQQ